MPVERVDAPGGRRCADTRRLHGERHDEHDRSLTQPTAAPISAGRPPRPRPHADTAAPIAPIGDEAEGHLVVARRRPSQVASSSPVMDRRLAAREPCSFEVEVQPDRRGDERRDGGPRDRLEDPEPERIAWSSPGASALPTSPAATMSSSRPTPSRRTSRAARPAPRPGDQRERGGERRPGDRRPPTTRSRPPVDGPRPRSPRAPSRATRPRTSRRRRRPRRAPLRRASRRPAGGRREALRNATHSRYRRAPRRQPRPETHEPRQRVGDVGPAHQHDDHAEDGEPRLLGRSPPRCRRVRRGPRARRARASPRRLGPGQGAPTRSGSADGPGEPAGPAGYPHDGSAGSRRPIGQ